MPLQNDEPVFSAPWQARTFALALQCHENGLFSWTEWADELSIQIAKHEQDSAVVTSDDYYTAWQAALEALVARSR